MDTSKITNSKLRYSKMAILLLENLEHIDIEKFEKWFLEESEQTAIGSATFTEYFIYLQKNGN